MWFLHDQPQHVTYWSESYRSYKFATTQEAFQDQVKQLWNQETGLVYSSSSRSSARVWPYHSRVGSRPSPPVFVLGLVEVMSAPQLQRLMQPDRA